MYENKKQPYFDQIYIYIYSIDLLMYLHGLNFNVTFTWLQEYEVYVLNIGEYDERVFLGEEAIVEIGTPTKV